MPTNVVRQVDGPDPSHGDTSSSRAPADYADEEARSWCHRTSPRQLGQPRPFAPDHGGEPSELTWLTWPIGRCSPRSGASSSSDLGPPSHRRRLAEQRMRPTTYLRLRFAEV